MLSGAAERWGDGPLFALGAAFALGAVVPPLWRARRSQPTQPWHERTATKLVIAVTGLAVGMNYFCTPYFFDVLHMHYGFAATIIIEHNPVFLYLMTCAYFTTYFAILCAAYRAACGLFRNRRGGRLPRAFAGVAACFAVAALETLLNANPWTRRLFCYDDRALALSLGTASYGACFALALPSWLAIDEQTALPPRRTLAVIADLAATLVAIVAVFALMRHWVAPRFTTVTPGHDGLRDIAGSCLAKPPAR